MPCNDKKYVFWVEEPSVLYKDSKFLEFIPLPNMDRVSQLNSLTRFSIYFIILALILNKPASWIQFTILFILFLIFLYYVFKSDKEGLKNEVFRLRGIDINAMGDEEYPENRDEVQEPLMIETGYYDSDNKLIVDRYNDAKTKSKSKGKRKKVDFTLDDHTEYEKSICRVPTNDNPFMNPLLSDISLGPDDPPVACNADDEEIKDKQMKCYEDKLYRDIEDLFERENSKRQFFSVPQTYPNDQISFANWLYKTDNICKVDQGKCLRYEDLRYKRVAQANY
jgi:Family of unknown function (DUF5762)